MKTITLLFAGILSLSAGISLAEEIIATSELVDGNTVITCAPAEPGSIDKAYITLYREGVGAAERNSMDISVDNKATYQLPGIQSKVEGRCKIFILKRRGVNTMPSREKAERVVLTGRFSLTPE